MYEYVINTGVIVPDTQTLYDEVVGEWRGTFGADLAVSPDTPQGVMITAEVASREGIAVNNAALANQINPNIGGGVFLDAICALLHLERTKALPTIVYSVVFSGVAGTIIPQGSRVRSTAGYLFATAEAYILGPGGTITGDVLCTQPGPIAAPSNTLTTVVDSVLGWESVTNPIAGIVGQNEQSDASLRDLRRITLARQTISVSEAVISALYEIDTVTSVAFRENVAATTMTIDGISMLAHSIWVCVDGGADADIGMALYRTKTVGGNWTGSPGAVTVNVQDPFSGQTYAVKFKRPDRIAVFVQITVRVGGDTSDPTVVVPDAIAKWSDGEIPNEQGLKIGVGVSPFEIAAAVNYFHPMMTVTAVLLSRSGGSPAAGVLPMSLTERGFIDASYVTVTVAP